MYFLRFSKLIMQDINEMFNAVFLTHLQNLILIWFHSALENLVKNHENNQNFIQLSALVVNGKK